MNLKEEKRKGLTLASVRKTWLKKKTFNRDIPDFVATRVEHVQVHVLHQNG